MNNTQRGKENILGKFLWTQLKQWAKLSYTSCIPIHFNVKIHQKYFILLIFLFIIKVQVIQWLANLLFFPFANRILASKEKWIAVNCVGCSNNIFNHLWMVKQKQQFLFINFIQRNKYEIAFIFPLKRQLNEGKRPAKQ